MGNTKATVMRRSHRNEVCQVRGFVCPHVWFSSSSLFFGLVSSTAINRFDVTIFLNRLMKCGLSRTGSVFLSLFFICAVRAVVYTSVYGKVASVLVA